MPTHSISPALKSIPSSALFIFLAVTFLITWGLIGAYILAPDMTAANFGEISGSHPFFFVATWAPAIAAFVVMLFDSGTSGLRAFLSRLLLWRWPVGWVGFILLFLPLVFVAGSLIEGGPMLAPLPPKGLGPVVALLFMMLFLGPIEEFGWRGVMQPLPQRHMERKHPEWLREDLAQLFVMLAEGRFDPVLAEILPLTKVHEAHERVEAGDVKGKLVLRVAER